MLTEAEIPKLFERAAERIKQNPAGWCRGVTHHGFYKWVDCEGPYYPNGDHEHPLPGLPPPTAPACWLGQIENCHGERLTTEEVIQLSRAAKVTLGISSLTMFNDKAGSYRAVVQASRDIAAKLTQAGNQPEL